MRTRSKKEMDKDQLKTIIDLKEAIENLISATSVADKRFSEVKTKEDLAFDKIKELIAVFAPVSQADAILDKTVRQALQQMDAKRDPLLVLILGALAMRFSANGTTIQMLCSWVVMLHNKAMGSGDVSMADLDFGPSGGSGNIGSSN